MDFADDAEDHAGDGSDVDDGVADPAGDGPDVTGVGEDVPAGAEDVPGEPGDVLGYAEDVLDDPGDVLGYAEDVPDDPGDVLRYAPDVPGNSGDVPAVPDDFGPDPVEPKARPSTGEPRVDAALARLGELEGRPVTEHRAVFEDVHRRLRDVLGELDSRQQPQSRDATDAAGRPGR